MRAEAVGDRPERRASGGTVGSFEGQPWRAGSREARVRVAPPRMHLYAPFLAAPSRGQTSGGRVRVSPRDERRDGAGRDWNSEELHFWTAQTVTTASSTRSEDDREGQGESLNGKLEKFHKRTTLLL